MSFLSPINYNYIWEMDGELERALDDACWDLGNGTITLHKTICENTLQKTLNSPTVVKVFQTNLAKL